MKCSECRRTTGGCRNGKDFKASQGCFGVKHAKRNYGGKK